MVFFRLQVAEYQIFMLKNQYSAAMWLYNDYTVFV